MKQILCVLALLALQLTATAQTPLLETKEFSEEVDVAYKVGGLGLGFSTMRDALLSPVLYRGIVLGAPTSYWKFKPSGWLRINSFQNGLSIDSSTAKSGKFITTLDLAFRQTYLKPLRTTRSNWQLYGGPVWEGLGNLRTSIGNVNNVLSYDVGLGIGGSLLLTNKLKIGNSELQLHNQVSTILLGAYIRPQYNWSLPIVDNENEEIIVNTMAGSWNVHRNWDYRFSADFYNNKYQNRFSRKKRKLIKQVAYRASLIWQYREFTGPSRFQRGQTLFQIGPIVKL